MIKLSVLDQSPVSEGSSPAEALAQTAALAREAERLGYFRFWVAEHHFAPGLAGSSPEVLMAHLAAVTSSIRIGSGGILLPTIAHTRLRRISVCCRPFIPGASIWGSAGQPAGRSGRPRFARIRKGRPGSLFPADCRFDRLSEQWSGPASPFCGASGHACCCLPAGDLAARFEQGQRGIGRQAGNGLAFARFINFSEGEEAMAAYRAHFAHRLCC